MLNDSDVALGHEADSFSIVADNSKIESTGQQNFLKTGEVMKLDKHFDKFHSNIKLNPDREERIKSAYRNLKSFIENDGPLSEAALDLFLQGSVAINTAIRPSEEGTEFDADAVFVLDLKKLPSDKQSPQDVIAWVATRLRDNPLYEGKVRERPRCVRIEYAGDFHLDVVPARLVAGRIDILEVPDKENRRWQLSNPLGYAEWASDVDLNSNGKFNRIVKMLKRWRDLRFTEQSCPKSILLTTLLGNHASSGYSSDAEALVATMESLVRELEPVQSVPFVGNPSLPEENLARDWTQEDFETFKNKFSAATKQAREALDEGNKEKSIKRWIDIFGDSFPKLTEEDAKTMTEAVKAVAAFVTSTGRLSVGEPKSETSVVIPRHRFYGASYRNSKSRN
jgi:hypothetical protein